MQDQSFTENAEFKETDEASFQQGFRGGERQFKDESEPEYGRDSDIPPGPDNLGERSFDDRPLPGPGREHLREPWDIREVHSDTVL